MALKLAWDPVAGSAPEVRDAVSLLNRDFVLLHDTERHRLEAFFQAGSRRPATSGRPFHGAST